jgi:cytochrome c oxidase subunit II
MLAPPTIWWRTLGRYEKNWLIIAFMWCLLMTAMMPLWFVFGKQNVPTTSYRVTPERFQAATMQFVETYKVGEEKGIPIVQPPPGDIYLLGRQWQWYPILKLKKGEEYRLHLSSLDILHGLSIQPVNINLMAVPGYDYVITFTPTTSGDFSLVCNEYCLVGHHVMVGKLIVED